jgi:hypothetical protein
MSMSKLIALSGLLMSSQLLAEQAMVIYGVDHRLEVEDAAPHFQKLARSVVTMVPSENLKFDNHHAKLNQSTLREWLSAHMGSEAEASSKRLTPLAKQMAATNQLQFCPDERFIDQPNPGLCTGFLIAPDLVVTAGHCTMEPSFCEDNFWVFGFKQSSGKQAGEQVDSADVYRCKRLITGVLDMQLGLDHAIVQLDRPVAGREPLELNLNSVIPENAPLTVIGSPSGLPLKVAGGANVRDNSHPFFFSANLDTFQGNSGSPVINTKTGMVEGILVRGEEDFTVNMEFMCLESNRCDDSECRGEDVSRLSSIPELAALNPLLAAARLGDMQQAEAILSEDFWVDIYGKDGKSALLVAAEAGQARILDLLLKRGADLSLQDTEGNTALHYAVKKGSLASVRVLLKAGANSRLTNKQGRTPVELARELKFERAILLFLAHKEAKL